jgi:hypothetical protein
VEGNMDQALNKCIAARARGIERAKVTKVVAKAPAARRAKAS